MNSPSRVLVLGLDGATFDVLEPLWREGRCPNLRRLADRGVCGPLRSVAPPLSFPAWSTFLTGKDPGRHGVFGFTSLEPGTYRLRFVNAGDRVGRSFWMRLSEAGRRVCCLGVPATYPPEPLNGVMVCGFDAPGVDARADRAAVHPPEILDVMEEAEGPYVISADIRPLLEADQREAALDRILETVDRKGRHALHLYRREPWATFMVLFGETDLVGHHYWRFHDPASPFPTDGASARLRSAVREVYERVDGWVGRFLELAEADGETAVLAISDHGFGGAGSRVLRVNRFLQRHGLVTFRKQAGAAGTRWLQALKLWGLRALPNSFKRSFFRHAASIAGSWESRIRFGAMDWSGTLAWSDEAPNYPSIWINLRGRQPHGTVEPQDYESVRDRVAAALESWRDPLDGSPVVRSVRRREEVYQGDLVDRAPDLVVDWNTPDGMSYLSRPSYTGEEPLEALDPDTLARPGFHDKSGSHRPDGVFFACGPGIGEGVRLEAGSAHLRDLCPTILHLMGEAIPGGLDGRVLTEALDFEYLRARPPRVTTTSGEGGEGAGRSPYTEAEEEVIAERLRGMGYL